MLTWILVLWKEGKKEEAQVGNSVGMISDQKRTLKDLERKWSQAITSPEEGTHTEAAIKTGDKEATEKDEKEVIEEEETIIKENSTEGSVETTDTGTIGEGTTLGGSKEVSVGSTEKTGSKGNRRSTNRHNNPRRVQPITTTKRQKIIDSL